VNKQIRTCAFDVKIDNGTTNASMQGYPKNVEVFSGSYEWRPYYYGGSATDEALSGRLRSRLGGYRIEGQLTWERQVNSTNFLNVLNDITIGTEKVMIAGTFTNAYTANTNIAIDGGLSLNDAYNGMRLNIPTVGNRTITDYFASNTTAILNASVTLGGTEAFNIIALSNMIPRVFVSPDANNARTEQVVVTESAWTASLQSTIVNQPTSVTFRGTNVENTIPSYYQL
jgi:hypothetical protein